MISRPTTPLRRKATLNVKVEDKGRSVMALRVAINGCGRIGRLVLRAAIESGRKDIEFMAIDDFGTAEVNAHRVPATNVSLIGGKVNTISRTTPDEINRAFERAAVLRAFKGVGDVL